MAVQWEQENRVAVYLQGRETFRYENLDAPLIVFEGSRIHHYAPHHWPESAIRSQETTAEAAAATTKFEELSAEL
jgi:hypothetical protein